MGAFENTEAKKVLYDYNQFSTKILTSQRGGGKTWLVQEKLLNRYFKNGDFFVVLRESQVEVDLMLQGGFWDDELISKEKFCNHDYKTIGNKILIDGVIVGIAIALTTYGNFRGTVLKLGVKEVKHNERKDELEEQVNEAEKFVKKSMNKLKTIFFDEFEPISPKMSSEKRFTAYKHICETLFRFRKGVEVIMCANIENSYSVFLSEFRFNDLKDLTYGIKKSYTARGLFGDIDCLAVWIHIKANNDWIKMRDDSYVGRLSRGKDDEMFMLGGVSKGNNFIKMPNKPLPRYVMFNITDGTNILTLWRVKNESKYYITEKSKGTTYKTFSFNNKVCGVGINLIPNLLAEQILNIFDNDMIEFDTSKTYSLFIEMIPKRSVKRE